MIGFLIARQPITTFRYLREARYQRERHKTNSDRQRVDVETVHIDLARHDTDLIQLSFIERDEDLDGIGIAIAGIVDYQNCCVLSVNQKFNDIIGFDFIEWAFTEFGCPILLENDARAALIGEWKYGSAKGIDIPSEIGRFLSHRWFSGRPFQYPGRQIRPGDRADPTQLRALRHLGFTRCPE